MWKKIMGAAMSLVLIAGLNPVAAYAGGRSLQTEGASLVAGQPSRLQAQAEGDDAHGTQGTCEWRIDADGLLTIFSGTLSPSFEDDGWVIWEYYGITGVRFDGKVSGGTSLYEMFRECGITAIDLSGLDTSSVTDMRHMFYDCGSLTSIDLSGLDISSVTDMRGMFCGCESLAFVDMSGLDTSGVKYMGGMFATEPTWGEDVSRHAVPTRLKLGEKTKLHADCGLHGGTWEREGDGVTRSTAQLIAASGTAEGAGTWVLIKEDMSSVYIASIPEQSYTGSAVRPKPRVLYGSFDEEYGYDLVEGVDYTVSYRDNVAVGTATVVVTGKGRYEGSKSARFKIVDSGKAAQPMTAKAPKKKVAVKASKAGKKAVVVKGAVSVEGAKGAVSFKNASKAKKAKKLKVNRKTGAITVPKGTKKGTYKVKVRVSAAGDASYEPGWKEVTVKVVVR